MQNRNQNCLLIFTKSPEVGFVKTRLTPFLNNKDAANLAVILLKHTLSIVTHLPNVDIRLHILGDVEHACFAPYKTDSHISFHQQQGNDFGARIALALQSALLDYKHVVIIGSDCAVMTSVYIENAFQHLAQTSNVIIGPSLDGGYVLLGLNFFYSALFYDMPWSTASVLSTTRARLASLNVKWLELSILWDIDVLDDLHRFHQWYLSSHHLIDTLSDSHSYHEIFNFVNTIL